MDTMDYVTWNTDHKWSDPSFEGEDNSKEKIQPVRVLERLKRIKCLRNQNTSRDLRMISKGMQRKEASEACEFPAPTQSLATNRY